MEELANDPIITFYIKMSESTDAETQVPLYSETMLRMSFKEVFGAMRPINPTELELYRKLIMLHFSENFPSMSDLATIMNCFGEHEIREYLDNYRDILEEWRAFLNAHLFDVVYKEALIEILYDYTIRYLSIFGEADDNWLKSKGEEIQRFLRNNDKLPKQWFRSFKALLKNRMNRMEQEKYVPYQNLTDKDLNLNAIYMHVKPCLNFFVVEAISKRDAEDNTYVHVKSEPPPRKKSKMGTAEMNVIGTKQYTDQPHAEFDRDAEIPVVNESEYILGEDHLSCSASFEATDNDIKLECNDDDIEVLQEVDVISNELNTNDDSMKHKNQGNSESSDRAEADRLGDPAEESRRNQTIIDYDTALSYISALQAYAVVNVHFEAICLLDEVDSMFRRKHRED